MVSNQQLLWFRIAFYYDCMHHPVGATPLAEESFMNIPRYTMIPNPSTLNPEPCTLSMCDRLRVSSHEEEICSFLVPT